MDRLSMYEILSMQAAYSKRSKDAAGSGLSDEDFEAAKDKWRKMRLDDVAV